MRSQKRKSWEEIYQTPNDPQERFPPLPDHRNLNIVLLLSLGIRETALTAAEPRSPNTGQTRKEEEQKGKRRLEEFRKSQRRPKRRVQCSGDQAGGAAEGV